MIEINVIGRPAPQGSKRHLGRGVMVEASKHVTPWREAVKFAARAAIKAEPNWQPIDGPVSVEMVFRLQRPKKPGWIVPAGPPDLDKLQRSTLDGLTEAGVIYDDSRVVTIGATKRWTSGWEYAGATIRIRTLAEVER